ncbi:MAG: ABC transporter ATP-binding protein [Candidatus Thorarchaeota archaeon]|nr:ABC transporter ATP-binding protein [Candidatus Thorarchaeota archaeon]
MPDDIVNDSDYDIGLLTEDDVDESEEVTYAVRLVDVHREFTIRDQTVKALNGVSLDVAPGEFVVVDGPSGAGKTTLLNVIGALDYTTSGRVILMDVPINDYDESFRATFRLTYTGFIFQSYNLISTLTALENIMFPMQLSDKPIKDIEAQALNLLTQVSLADRQHHLPWQLSSGEQQRVAIARAMANDPPLILADEPTANLDDTSADIVRKYLVELNGRGKTVIVMTHDDKIIQLDGVRRFHMVDGVLSEVE